jgi:hypothetical protein|tara:strand:+ start:40 stop:402 length:363 start_codon:yes stop_codon:yes gene_type:complete
MTEIADIELETIGLIVRMAFTHEHRPSIAVREWGRDCDQFETTRAFIITAGDQFPVQWKKLSQGEQALWWPINLLEQLLERETVMEDNKEGPCSMTIISEQEYKEFQPRRSDRRAEQYGY